MSVPRVPPETQRQQVSQALAASVPGAKRGASALHGPDRGLSVRWPPGAQASDLQPRPAPWIPGPCACSSCVTTAPGSGETETRGPGVLSRQEGPDSNAAGCSGWGAQKQKGRWDGRARTPARKGRSPLSLGKLRVCTVSPPGLHWVGVLKGLRLYSTGPLLGGDFHLSWPRPSQQALYPGRGPLPPLPRRERLALQKPRPSQASGPARPRPSPSPLPPPTVAAGAPSPVRSRQGADGRQLWLCNRELVAWQPEAAHYRGHSD